MVFFYAEHIPRIPEGVDMEMLKGPPAYNRRAGRPRISTAEKLMSRSRFDKAAPKEVVAGDIRPLPAGPGKVGTK